MAASAAASGRLAAVGRLVGNAIAVDHFPEQPNVKCCHFLSSAQRKNIVGLSEKWALPIFCSAETAAVLPNLTAVGPGRRKGVDPNLIRALEMNQRHQMDGFSVTLLDADSLTGAVMFLFEEVAGATVLYTGDMRADKEMMLRFRREPAFSRLSALHLDELFIDVAGYGEIEDQPTRSQCLMTLTDMILDRQEADYLIACDRFGYEKFVSELALRLHLYIAMSDRQLEICRLLQLDRAFVATDDPEVKIRVDRSANVRKRMAQDSEAGYFTKAIYLDRDDYIPPRKKSLCSERSIVVHYACHSTRNELHRFIERLQFKRLSPLNGKLTEQEMTELLSLGQVPQPIRDEQLTIPACFKRIIDQYDSHSASRIIAECGSWNSLTRDEDDWMASLLGGPSIADTTTTHQNEQSRPPVENSDTSTNEDTATEPEEEEAAKQLNEAVVLSSKITDSDRNIWLTFIEYITVTNAK